MALPDIQRRGGERVAIWDASPNQLHFARLLQEERNRGNPFPPLHPNRVFSPPPADPTCSFMPGMMRAAEVPMSPVFHRGRVPPDAARDRSASPPRRVREPRTPQPEEEEEEEEARPLSPSNLPGVRAIPREMNRFLRAGGQLVPGQYFAKSMTRYLGPYEHVPTVADLPVGDRFIILQRMGRLPENNKSVFRHVTEVDTRF